MTDDKPHSADETQPVRPDSGATLPPPPAVGPDPAPADADGATAPAAAYHAEQPATRRGFRERLASLRRSEGNRTFGLAALVASALAGLIVGGLGFATVHAVGDDGPRDRGGLSQRGDDDEGPGGRGGSRGGPPGAPGRLPPTPLPDDEDSGD